MLYNSHILYLIQMQTAHDVSHFNLYLFIFPTWYFLSCVSFSNGSVEHLAEDPVNMVFNSHLQRSFNHLPEVTGNMESEWAMFCAAIAEAAAQSCGSKVRIKERERRENCSEIPSTYLSSRNQWESWDFYRWLIKIECLLTCCWQSMGEYVQCFKTPVVASYQITLSLMEVSPLPNQDLKLSLYKQPIIVEYENGFQIGLHAGLGGEEVY